MLELRQYTYDEMARLMGTKSVQGIRRKLTRYAEFTEAGRGAQKVFTVTAIPDRFKTFCVFDLGFGPTTDFTKLRNFLFYLLSDEDFRWRPMEVMEEYMRINGKGVTRQTINTYLKRLATLNLAAPWGEMVYYKVYKDCGAQTHEKITAEEYKAAWKVYWECISDGYDSRSAYQCMYNRVGGTPRKQRAIAFNAITNDLRDTLWELVQESTLAENEN